MRQVPFESFTYPFFDFNYVVDPSLLAQAFFSVADPSPHGQTGLYVHIPFCDTICDFCPYFKSVSTAARVSEYLDAVIREAQLRGASARCQSLTVNAIYVGGGTPSVLEVEEIKKLITGIRANFHIAPDAEVTFEFEPKSISLVKLQALRELGFTRVSFGVQTFDPKLRSFVNLTATLRQIEQAIEWSVSLFDATNFDLMVGFPGQLEESALRDVEFAARSGIASVSIYPVDYVMTVPKFLDRIARREIPRPGSIQERHRMFHRARRELRKYFEEQNIYCYGNQSVRPCRYMFDILYGSYNEQYIGLGVGAYSVLKGLILQNIAHEGQYVQEIKSGRVPVYACSPYHAYEKGLVFFPKRMSYDSRELEDLGIAKAFVDRIQQSIDAGLVKRDGSVLTLTEAGQDDYAALMTDFFSDHQRRLYDRICQKLRQQVGWDESERDLNVSLTRISKQWGGITSMKKP